ncbi:MULTISPECIES: thioesterase II family protein [unclassified Streptomyces]|uniref:thioesterase II family protein n=1 Tax=unclassified Streptomyces TaxID=2593676 RepID=UPI0035DB19E2
MTVPATRGAASPSSPSGVWLRRYRPLADPAVRLVCFPHAGGSATAYLGLAAGLAGAGVEVLAVQYPGRQDRRGEPFVKTVDALVEAVLPELREWTGGPFALFGHSLGGTLAYETARRLTALGEKPVHLFVSGRRAPTVPRTDTAHLLDDRALIARIAALQGTDPELLRDEELLRMVLPALRNDYGMAGSYRHLVGTPLSVPLTVLTGDSDPNVSVDDARRWSEVAGGPVELHVLPGGHFFLDERPENVRHIIEEALDHVR